MEILLDVIEVKKMIMEILLSLNFAILGGVLWVIHPSNSGNDKLVILDEKIHMYVAFALVLGGLGHIGTFVYYY